MAKKKTTLFEIENHKIQGHSIQIHKKGELKKLYIDGERYIFFSSKDGFNLDKDAYSPPQKSLLKAVELYLKKLNP